MSEISNIREAITYSMSCSKRRVPTSRRLYSFQYRDYGNVAPKQNAVGYELAQVRVRVWMHLCMRLRLPMLLVILFQEHVKTSTLWNFGFSQAEPASFLARTD
jgi:hypothetical protein